MAPIRFRLKLFSVIANLACKIGRLKALMLVACALCTHGVAAQPTKIPAQRFLDLTPDQTKFIGVAGEGNLNEIERLLKSGVDLHTCDKATGISALSTAIKNKQWRVVQNLFDRGFDPAKTFRHSITRVEVPIGDMALYEAAQQGKAGLIFRLLKKGIDPNGTKLSLIENPLNAAVASHAPDAVEVLLAGGASVGKSEMAASPGPVGAAVRNRDGAILELLLPAADDVDLIAVGGRTALSFAVESDWREGVILLIEHGANPNLSTVPEPFEYAQNPAMRELILRSQMLHEKGRMPGEDDGMSLVIAINLNDETGFLEKISRTDGFFYRDGNGYSPLIHAIDQNRFGLARKLVEAGAPVNVFAKSGASALAFAAKSGDLELVRLLIARGARVDAALGDGSTPLMVAARGKSVEVVKELLASGAEIDSPSHFDSEAWATPLMIAARTNNLPTVRLLLENGAEINALDQQGNNVLAHAAISNNPELIQYLVDHGANLESVNSAGGTPLTAAYLAAAKASIAKFRELGVPSALAADMDISRTPLQSALTDRNYPLALELLEKGADPNAIGRMVVPPLLQAISDLRFEPEEVVVKLVEALLRHGANPDLGVILRDAGPGSQDLGDTPLMEAIDLKRLKVVALLLRAGANPAKANSRGKNAFDSLEEMRQKLSEKEYADLLKLLKTNWGMKKF